MDNKQSFDDFPSLLDLSNKQDEQTIQANSSQTKKSSLQNHVNKEVKKVTNLSVNAVNKSIDKTYNTVIKLKSKLKNNYLAKKTSWIRRFLLKLLSSNPLLKTLVLYLIVIFIFAGILICKDVQISSFYASSQNNFFFSFFTSLSTITATGMMLNPIPQTFNISGQVVLFFLIEFGGIIFSYIVNNVYLSFRENAGNKFNNQAIVQIEKGEDSISSSLSMIKWNIFVIGGIQLVFALALWACFYYIPGYEPANNPISGQYYVGYTHTKTIQYHNVTLSLWSGVFDSAGALSNAGMTLFGSANAMVYRNGIGIIVQFLFALEFILGGIGFPLFYDLVLKIKMHKRNQKYKLCLYSKLSLYAVFFVTIITTCFAYAFAYTDHHSEALLLSSNYDNNHKLNTIYSPFGTNPEVSKNWAIFFSMLNTHSAGYSSFNLEYLSYGNKWVYIISMFIGCCPSSSAGEIKLVMLISTFYFITKRLKIFNYFLKLKGSITKAMIFNSIMILILGLIISIIATICFFFFYIGPNYTGYNHLYNKSIDTIFLGVSVYSMCGLTPGNIWDQNFWGELTTLIVILASQMVLVFSIFIVQANSLNSDEQRKQRLIKNRQLAKSERMSDYLNR